MPISEVHNMDCMIGMRDYPDNHFDLAIVDPPYGIGISSNPVRQKHKKKNWDNNIPSKEYFDAQNKRFKQHIAQTVLFLK